MPVICLQGGRVTSGRSVRISTSVGKISTTWHRFLRDAGGEIVQVHESKLGDGYPRTNFGWPVSPRPSQGRGFPERYGKPIVITENGMSSHDWVAVDSAVHDPQRIDFTTRYLRELQRAAADGVPINGYFHWSLMDNFEWAEGYKHRFGLIHVDYLDGLKRTIKDSGKWYRGVIEITGRTVGAYTHCASLQSSADCPLD